MLTLLRQIVFLLIGTLLRWPLWLLIAILGYFKIFKMIFLVYPTDEVECSKFCPAIPLLRRFFSGRPTAGGLITDGYRPIGIYFVIPDLPQDLARKKNRQLAENIVQRLLWIRRLAGAQTIGLAGQLGPIFERRHNIPMDPPLFSSTNGNIFSIHEAINWAGRQKNLFQIRQKIAILGGGELGEALLCYLKRQGYHCNIVDVRYTRRGKIKQITSETNVQNLYEADFVVNLLPKGSDFLSSNFQNTIRSRSTIIDFSRPAIPEDSIPQRVYRGNRLRRIDMRFVLALPGGWKQQELPACSLPALLAALTGKTYDQLEMFCLMARQQAFSTALIDAPVTLVRKEPFPSWPAVTSPGDMG